jgi:hypothetical protein
VQYQSGGGHYVFAVYRGERAIDLASLFGGTSTVSRLVKLDSGTERRLTDLDRDQWSERFRRLQDPHGWTYSAGEHRDHLLRLTSGRCYRFAALGGPGAGDLSLILTNSRGESIVADTHPRRDALIEYCPAHDDDFVLQTEMVSGSGSAFTVGYEHAP